MAQIVCIDTGTKRANNKLGDIVSIHEDDVDLSGGGYSTFKIIRVKDISLSELNLAVDIKIPQQEVAFKTTTILWSLTRPEEKSVWKDGDIWRFLENPPKYALTAKNLIAQDISDLSDTLKTKTQKLMILDKVQEKISLDSSNLAEAIDLNVK